MGELAGELLNLYGGDQHTLDTVRADLQAAYGEVNGRSLAEEATDSLLHMILTAEPPENMGEPETIDEVLQKLGIAVYDKDEKKE